MNAYRILDLPATATRAEIRTAYRALARRWHPDRFAEGPERDWANEKMADINAAYRHAINHIGASRREDADAIALLRIEELIERGHYSNARKLLMNIATRCAEWNYLFGAVLLKTRDTKKALIYLSVAAHQRPDVKKYADALAAAQCRTPGVRERIAAILHAIV